MSENTLRRKMYPDLALLYLRILFGGIIILHNISKLQLYDQIVNTYPSFGVGSSAAFTAITIIQLACAVMIICGIWFRLAALIMAVGTFVAMIWLSPQKNWTQTELYIVNTGIYIFMVIIGCGRYSIDSGGWREYMIK